MVLLTVDDHKERLCSIVDCLIDGSSGTYKPAELPRQPNDRIGVRRLRALNAYGVGADWLHRLLIAAKRLNRSDSVSFHLVEGDFATV
jgi:hypothetical protein